MCPIDFSQMEDDSGNNVVVGAIQLFALTVMLIVCVLGNSYTLMALPYVRDKYKEQFSSFQSASFLLLLHLSFTDLLYGVLGFPHFIHGLVVGNAVVYVQTNDIM